MVRGTRERASPPVERSSSLRLLWLLGAMLFVTGACGLIYQQLWLRELSLVFGVTVYAATTVSATFMASFALGSRVFTAFHGNARELVR
jgi:spermidine synthase